MTISERLRVSQEVFRILKRVTSGGRGFAKEFFEGSSIYELQDMLTACQPDELSVQKLSKDYTCSFMYSGVGARCIKSNGDNCFCYIPEVEGLFSHLCLHLSS